MQIYNNISKDIKHINNAQTPVKANVTSEKASFENVLSGLQFSKHANMRLSSRDINLSNEQMERVEQGVNKAKEKGIRDSLVLVDDVALVVNTGSNLVITAMNQNKNLNDNIYTNIDGAVIV